MQAGVSVYVHVMCVCLKLNYELTNLISADGVDFRGHYGQSLNVENTAEQDELYDTMHELTIHLTLHYIN